MKRLSLKLGLCTVDDYRVECALERSSCDHPDDWRSPGVVIGSDVYRGRGDFCLLSGAVREKVLGRCGGSGDGAGPGRGDGSGPPAAGVAGRCAPNRESCQDADAPFFDDRVPFEESSPGCTVEETTFGRCGDRCSWSPADCGIDEPWTFPSEGCACGDVRTGACARGDGSGPGDRYCAVSGDACDADGGWTWLSPLELAASPDVDAECYACIRTTAPVEGRGASLPTDEGSRAGSREGSSSPSPSVVVGAAVGGALLLALLASLLITRRIKKRQSKSAETELKQTESVATTPIIGMNLKLDSADNDELVSNLDVEDLESSNLDVEDLENSDNDEVPNLYVEDLESSDKNEVSNLDVEDLKSSDNDELSNLDVKDLESSDNDELSNLAITSPKK